MEFPLGEQNWDVQDDVASASYNQLASHARLCKSMFIKLTEVLDWTVEKMSNKMGQCEEED